MPSHYDNQMPFLRTRTSRRRGQTAIIALLVLLLLSFVGGLFVTIVANNLRTQGRSHRTLNADYYAEAGLRYADDQLTNSLDGADWRPPLQCQLSPAEELTLIGPATSSADKRYQALGLTAPDPQDPDLSYLQQGFARYDTENGRFLLRVTYDPNNTATGTTRYIKIESVGREGIVIPNDPTTYSNQPAMHLAATLVAYKPIGITDYARFETNKDNRSGVMNIGVPSSFTTVTTGASSNAPLGVVTPGVYDFNTSGNQPVLDPFPIITSYGIPLTTGTGGTPGGGGSFRANGSVRFYGVNDFYLRTDTQQDNILVSGDLLLNDYNPGANLDNSGNPTLGQDSAISVEEDNDTTQTKQSGFQYPSNDTDPVTGASRFDTQGGFVRDGGTGANSSDANGGPRSVARLDPPIIDTVNSATSLTRYQDVTENSPARLIAGVTTGGQDQDTKATDPTAGQDGLGQAIYVNNTSDMQQESTSLVGGHTLVDEWLHRNGGGQSSTTAKSGWDGPFYNPPGVDVTFGLQQQTIGTKDYSFYGIRLTRSDTDSSGSPVLWKNTDGSQGTSPTMIVSYHDLQASNVQDPTATGYNASAPNLNNDVVIYCEGNVRIKPSLISAPASETLDTHEPPRLYPAPGSSGISDDALPRHITIVTNGTAYIEGSIIKGNSDSTITVLARDYVCLNTTQFYGGAIADQNPQSTQPPAASVADDTLLDFGAQNDVLVQDLNFRTGNYGTGTGTYALYLSGGPSAPGETQAQFDFVNPATGLGISANGQPFDNPLSQSFNTIGTVSSGSSSLTHTTIDLTNNTAFTALSPAPFLPLQLWTRLNPTPVPVAGSVSVATQDYVQERSAVLPMDIEIDAVLYAQDKSFFVIPGPWFNSDSNDNLQNYASGYTDTNGFPIPAGVRNNQGTSVIAPAEARFPFYGQPVDLKITLKGSVSENLPADISAQAAWMAKWGWIPQYHGSEALYTGGTTADFEKSGHYMASQPSVGLDLVYDPMAGFPYDSTTGYVRTDLYGRPLPFTPKLPVSTGLIYAGQSDPQSLLQ